MSHNDVTNFTAGPIRIIVDDEMVVIIFFCHFFLGIVESGLNGLFVIGFSFAQTFFQFVGGWRGDENGYCLGGKGFFQGVGALDVDIQEQGVSHLYTRYYEVPGGSVEVAVDLRPFDQFSLIPFFQKFFFGDKKVVLSVDFLNTFFSGGVGNGPAQSINFLFDFLDEGGFARARGADNNKHFSFAINVHTGKLTQILSRGQKCVTIWNMGQGRFLNIGRSGFTLMGTIITAGMMGGLSLLLAELTKKQHIVQRKAETELEITSMMSRMVRTLYRGEACNRTIGIGQPITNGVSIPSIKDEDGKVIFNKTDKYGNGLLKIDSMTLRNVRTSGNSREMELEVVLSKESKAISAFKKATRKLPLSAEVSGGTNNLLNCHYTGENLNQVISDVVSKDIDPFLTDKANTAKEELCTMMGGTYSSSSTPPCSFSGTFPSALSNIEKASHFVPPIVTTRSNCPCDTDEYICAKRGRDLVSRGFLLGQMHQYVCGIKPGSKRANRSYPMGSVCYLRDAAHRYHSVTSTTSCAEAQSDAKAAADPGNLATRVMGNGYAGKIYCDDDCTFDGSKYTIGCRLYPKGTTTRCEFECTTPCP